MDDTLVSTGPVRVLHTIDGLGGGGSERWVFDIARLSDPERCRHRVITIHPDLGRYVYAGPLRELGVYGARRPRRTAVAQPVVATAAWPRRARRLPDAVRTPLRAAWFWVAVVPAAVARIAVEVAVWRPHVLHAHTFHGFVAALQLRRLFAIPVVHTVPALLPQMADAGYGWMRSLYVRHHGLVDTFFTSYPEELTELGVPARKVRLIRGVIDLSAIDVSDAVRAAARRECRARLGIPADADLLLSVGRLHPSKGHADMVRALPLVLERCPGAHWVVLGEGEERERLTEMARVASVASRVHLPGFVTDPARWYRAADVFIRTNRFEADNLSSYHAMCVGLPVVGYDTSASTELLRVVGHGRLVPTGDASELAAAVVHLLSLPSAARREIGHRGVEYARAHLDIRQTIAMFDETYIRYGTIASRPQSEGGGT